MMPDYSTNDPKGWGGDPKRGAALGRPTILPDDRDGFTEKLYLRHIPLDSGGYDPNGTYFGHSPRQKLYWCASADLSVDFMVWGRNRDHAKTAIGHLLPGARFLR